MRSFKLLTTSLGRATALVVGGFTLINLLGGMLFARYSLHHWLVDPHLLSPLLTTALLVLTSPLLVLLALRPKCAPLRRKLTAWCIRLLIILSLAATVQFYRVLGEGHIRTSLPIPFTALLMVTLRFALGAIQLEEERCTARLELPLAFALFGGALFMLGHIYCLGKTTYTHKADVAIVFGARTYASGRLSDALEDRVTTAVRLYHRGQVRRLIMTGGKGDGAIHETTAMKRHAVKLGVPAEHILVDRGGHSTRASVINTTHMLKGPDDVRVIAVSHFYHLPRIRLEYGRRGLHVLTVPAIETYHLTEMPWYITREVAALTFAWLTP